MNIQCSILSVKKKEQVEKKMQIFTKITKKVKILFVWHFRSCAFWKNFVCLSRFFRILGVNEVAEEKTTANLRLKFTKDPAIGKAASTANWMSIPEPQRFSDGKHSHFPGVPAPFLDQGPRQASKRIHQEFCSHKYNNCVSSSFSHPQSGN